jgi:protein-disulfide isomerase
MLLVAAVVVLAAALWQRLAGPRNPRSLTAAQTRLLSAEPARPLVFNGSFPDTLVLFLDYQCRYCAALYPELVRADAPYGVIVRHLVGDRNSLSAQAAVAAECARMEGKFHAYSYALFARRDSIGVLSWQAYANAAGLPESDALSRCIESRATIQVTDRDTKLGTQLGLNGTPAAVVRGMVYVGPSPILEALRDLTATGR